MIHEYDPDHPTYQDVPTMRQYKRRKQSYPYSTIMALTPHQGRDVPLVFKMQAMNEYWFMQGWAIEKHMNVMGAAFDAWFKGLA